MGVHNQSGQRLADEKRQHGRFFTMSKSPFELPAFQEWAQMAGLPAAPVLEPFAGGNHIIHALQEIGLCEGYASYDIAPAHKAVKKRNTIRTFPKGFEVCVTNPPWLARNSATRRGLPYPTRKYDNVYKHCVELCLANCEYVAALLPASYLQSGLFRERLHTYILLHNLIFADTENPVCLALFAGARRAGEDINIYYDDEFIAPLSALERKIPLARKDRKVRFNDPGGRLGFISFDNTRESSIRFCAADEIEEYEIKNSSRFITRISGDFGNVRRLIGTLNAMLDELRRETKDVFLTPFKGMRSDGYYRRRMFFSQARELIDAA